MPKQLLERDIPIPSREYSDIEHSEIIRVITQALNVSVADPKDVEQANVRGWFLNG